MGWGPTYSHTHTHTLLAHGYPVVLFIDKDSPFLLSCLCTLVENQSAIDKRVYFWTLFCWSMRLSLCSNRTVLITVAPWQSWGQVTKARSLFSLWDGHLVTSETRNGFVFESSRHCFFILNSLFKQFISLRLSQVAGTGQSLLIFCYSTESAGKVHPFPCSHTWCTSCHLRIKIPIQQLLCEDVISGTPTAILCPWGAGQRG